MANKYLNKEEYPLCINIKSETISVNDSPEREMCWDVSVHYGTEFSGSIALASLDDLAVLSNAIDAYLSGMNYTFKSEDDER